MSSLYIYHHLGLGDHIICNAIVRIYAKLHDHIFLFAKPHNFKNVSYMYRDLSNIRFISMDDAQVRFFMKVNPDNKYLIVGHDPEYFQKVDNKTYRSFDDGLYQMALISIEEKWNQFFFLRDLEKEKNVFYNILKLSDSEEYIFVHDDPKNSRNLKKSLIPSNIKIIQPIKFSEVGLFDFIYTIEKAKEVHVMNSSFMNLIDCMQLKNDNIFYHEYSRPGIDAMLKLNWTIYK